MSNSLITKKLIDKAIKLLRPSIKKILEQENAVWGPGYVSVVVIAPGLNDYRTYVEGFFREWDPQWGEPRDFEEIATNKAVTSNKHGKPSWEVVQKKPYLLLEGDFLYRGGYAEEVNSLATGVSGATSETDEFIGKLVFDTIEFLVILKVRDMLEDGRNQL